MALSYSKLSPLLVRAPAPNASQSLAAGSRAAHHSATCIEPTNIVSYPLTSSMRDSALLIESTCLKERHSHLKADFFSLFFFSSASVCCVYLPYSSDPEHWLPGPFFPFFIFYTILIFFTLPSNELCSLRFCLATDFPRILQLLTVLLVAGRLDFAVQQISTTNSTLI